eukprot:scaffold705_cov402-Prasinococcus_capsulatus_cf.AAC.46
MESVNRAPVGACSTSLEPASANNVSVRNLQEMSACTEGSCPKSNFVHDGTATVSGATSVHIAKELQYALEHPSHGHVLTDPSPDSVTNLRRMKLEQEIVARRRDETLKLLATHGKQFNLLPSTLQKQRPSATCKMASRNKEGGSNITPGSPTTDSPYSWLLHRKRCAVRAWSIYCGFDLVCTGSALASLFIRDSSTTLPEWSGTEVAPKDIPLSHKMLRQGAVTSRVDPNLAGGVTEDTYLSDDENESEEKPKTTFEEEVSVMTVSAVEGRMLHSELKKNFKNHFAVRRPQHHTVTEDDDKQHRELTATETGKCCVHSLHRGWSLRPECGTAKEIRRVSAIDYENSRIRMMRAQLQELELLTESLDSKGHDYLARKLQNQARVEQVKRIEAQVEALTHDLRKLDDQVLQARFYEEAYLYRSGKKAAYVQRVQSTADVLEGHRSINPELTQIQWKRDLPTAFLLLAFCLGSAILMLTWTPSVERSDIHHTRLYNYAAHIASPLYAVDALEPLYIDLKDNPRDVFDVKAR